MDAHGLRRTAPDPGFPGGHRSRVTPVPIPNTEVKLATADGTVGVTPWESRSLPGIFEPDVVSRWRRAFFWAAAPPPRETPLRVAFPDDVVFAFRPPKS